MGDVDKNSNDPTDHAPSLRKRKADSLTRLSIGNSAGRGAKTGWTLCPLCGRHSQKRFALGRGIAAHLHAVHTPWNPGKAERKKRRRIQERIQKQGVESVRLANNDAVVQTRQVPWEPSEQEISEWNQQVLTIVQSLEEKIHDTEDTSPNKSPLVGLDRSGNKAKAYKESLPPFVQAAAAGNLVYLKTSIETALKSGNASDLLNTRDRHQSIAEHWAAGGGHLECLRYLVRTRRSLTTSNDSKHELSLPTSRKLRRRDGKTCLHYAARNGRLACAKFLIEEERCVVDAPAGDGTTPLHLACYGGHQSLVEYLLQRGANIHQCNEWGCSVAHWVAMTRSESVHDVRRLFSFLKDKGPSFVSKQNQGHSPLHKAAQYRIRTFVEWMLDPKESGGAGLTADEKRLLGEADDGNHTPSEIWISAGGDRELGSRMKEFGW